MPSGCAPTGSELAEQSSTVVDMDKSKELSPASDVLCRPVGSLHASCDLPACGINRDHKARKQG